MLGTIIFLKNFNNYFNREVKQFDTLSEYSDYMVGTLPNVNFNPNDGVNTKVDQLIDNPSADYLLYTENNVIISRWFILESQRKTSGLWELTLRRDVIADNWQRVLEAPTYIEKAIVNEDNNLICNDEPFTCNQVKTLEKELYDETNTAWIVGYLDRGFNSDGQAGPIEFNSEVIPDYTATTLSSWDKYDLLNTAWRSMDSTVFKFRVKIRNGTRGVITISKNDVTLSNTDQTSPYLASTSSASFNQIIYDLKQVSGLYSTLSGYKNVYINNIDLYNTTNLDDAAKLTNKVLKTNDKPLEYYTMNSFTSIDKKQTYVIAAGECLSYLKGVLNGLTNVEADGTGSAWMDISYTSTEVYPVLSQQGTYKLQVQKDRYHLKDGPYDMFIMPYGEVDLKIGEAVMPCDKRSAMSIAQGIAQNLGSFIYDVQILPFCPATGFIITESNDKTTIDVNTTNTKRYSFITDGSNNNRGAVIWCTASSGSKYIPYKFNGITNQKLFNSCVKFRLSAGNYAAGFDFSPVKNGGVDGFNVDYTYIPYNPYIRMAPNFGRLYGKDFQDCRGLIIQGDHSITYLNDRWIEYQVNNKNYLNAFNRQMENMEVQRTAERWSQVVGATVGAAGAGVQAGSVFGVGVGIGAGALSTVGGAADYLISEHLYDENKRYAKDQFRYSLENVQALPRTLAKVVAYTPNNKIVPVLEVYYPTAEDAQAFCNMIRYQGMTVGVIGKFSEYVYNSWSYGGVEDKGFIKGRPLQLKDLSEDYHLATAIADEMGLGLYTKDN